MGQNIESIIPNHHGGYKANLSANHMHKKERFLSDNKYYEYFMEQLQATTHFENNWYFRLFIDNLFFFSL